MVYNENAGKFAGTESWSVVNTGVELHSGGARTGEMSVIDFEEISHLQI